MNTYKINQEYLNRLEKVKEVCGYHQWDKQICEHIHNMHKACLPVNCPYRVRRGLR